jgi:hypothetical protein
MFICENNLICIREKRNDTWYTVYKNGGIWIDFICDKNLEYLSYKQVIDDQDEIKKILIGLI